MTLSHEETQVRARTNKPGSLPALTDPALAPGLSGDSASFLLPTNGQRRGPGGPHRGVRTVSLGPGALSQGGRGALGLDWGRSLNPTPPAWAGSHLLDVESENMDHYCEVRASNFHKRPRATVIPSPSTRHDIFTVLAGCSVSRWSVVCNDCVFPAGTHPGPSLRLPTPRPWRVCAMFLRETHPGKDPLSQSSCD